MGHARSRANDGRALAALLRDHKEELIRSWTQRVLTDPNVPEAARLSEPSLRDHIPDLLDDLIRALDGSPAADVRRTARKHAAHRLSLGYELVEELRELAHFRAAILDLCAGAGLRLDGGALTVLNAAIDESMLTGASEMGGEIGEALERRAALIDESHDAVFSWRIGGTITWWSRGAQQLYGWSKAEVLGREPHALLHTEHPAGMREIDAIVGREGRWEGELRQIARDGRKVIVEARLVLVRDDTGQPFVHESNRDITERTRIEEEREHLLESERAARVEAERATHLRDEFVATVSHELRTPLNAILGWTGMLRGGKLAGAATEKALEVIERNARAQAELVEDLFDMSRIGSGKLRLDVREVDLGAVVENAVASHLPEAQKKGLVLEKTLETSGSPVRGDPGRLEQIVSNLLSNAIKFTPAGGRAAVLLRRVGSRVELVVRDTGQGIDADFLPHVFDRFRQAEASLTRKHRGLGLGLSLVKFLVEQHGGEIRAHSDGPGKGADFTVTLPIAAVRQDAESAADSPIEACAAIAGLRALVVDDEEDARALLQRILEQCGATAITVGTAGEALEQIREARPDVLISDISMPERDGYQLIRAVRALDPAQGGRTPAVALTAFARPEDRLRAQQAGYQMHLTKPVEQSELVVVVASVAGRLANQRR